MREARENDLVGLARGIMDALQHTLDPPLSIAEGMAIMGMVLAEMCDRDEVPLEAKPETLRRWFRMLVKAVTDESPDR